MPQVGMIFPPWFPPERLRPTALAAEAAGVDELWVWEDCFFESGLAAASAVLAWTEQLHVRVGLLPVPLRNVAIEAMEIATVDRLFPGRFQPVVGHGVQSWMGQVGARAESPLTLLREHVVALDALLAGDEMTTAGRYVVLDGVRLAWPPSEPVRVWAGGVGERTLAMLGEVAAGVLVDSGTSPSRLREIVALVVDAARAAGRTDVPQVALYVHAIRGAEARERLAAVFEPTGDLDTELGLAGDAAAIADGIGRYVAAGADTVILRPPEDEPDIEGYATWVGAEVMPLLR